MSSTDNKPQQTDIAQSGKVVRMSAGAIDEQYIFEYINDPRSKVAALRRAQEATGIDCHVSRSRAFDIHKRLKHRIESAVDDLSSEGAILGYSILLDLAVNGENEQTRAGCATKLIEYGGRNKPRQIEQPKSRENIKEQIEQTKARILSITGGKI